MGAWTRRGLAAGCDALKTLPSRLRNLAARPGTGEADAPLAEEGNLHRSIIAVVLLAAVGAAGATPKPDCSVAKTARVSFRGPHSGDLLSAAVVGSCVTARLRISIHAVDGVLLYGYDAPFVDHVVVPKEHLPRAARDLVTRVLAESMRDDTGSLPPYAPPYEYCSQHYGILKVTRKQYEALRREKRPMLRHPIGYEAWRLVVYDAAGRRAITLLEGGPDRCP